MLKKLMKHDLKQTFRPLIVFYGILLLLSIVIRGCGLVTDIFEPIQTVQVFTTTIYVLGLIGCLFFAFANSIVLFYKETMKDQGYLMHTLPVTKRQLVFSKTLVALIALIVSVVIVLLTLMVAYYQPGGLNDIIELIEVFSTMFLGLSLWPFAIIFVLYMLLAYVHQILYFYFSMSLGQTRPNNKLMYSVVFGILINVVIQIITSIMLLIETVFQPDIITNSEVVTPETVAWLLIPTMVLTTIFTIVFHYGTSYFLDKKLNME